MKIEFSTQTADTDDKGGTWGVYEIDFGKIIENESVSATHHGIEGADETRTFGAATTQQGINEHHDDFSVLVWDVRQTSTERKEPRR